MGLKSRSSNVPANQSLDNSREAERIGRYPGTMVESFRLTGDFVACFVAFETNVREYSCSYRTLLYDATIA